MQGKRGFLFLVSPLAYFHQKMKKKNHLQVATMEHYITHITIPNFQHKDV